MNEHPQQKTYLITGASRGVGQAIRSRLTERGHRVFSLHRTESEAPENRVDWIKCDLAQAQDVQHAARTLNEQGLSRLDGVFLNAARGVFGSVADLPPEAMAEIFRVNLFSHVELLTELRQMLPPGTPVVCISTSASRIPAPGMGAYAASKLALESLMQTLCLEQGWKLSILRPAEIDTNFAAACGVPDHFDHGVSKLDPARVAERAVTCLENGRIFANVGLRARIIDAVVRIRPQWLMKRRLKTDVKPR